jgi:hypothetical protein
MSTTLSSHLWYHRDMKVISLRIPDKVHEALVSASKRESRSVNGQIVHFINEGVMVPQWEAQSIQMFRERRQEFMDERLFDPPDQTDYMSIAPPLPEIERVREDA